MTLGGVLLGEISRLEAVWLIGGACMCMGNMLGQALLVSVRGLVGY